jgi:hydroxymethylbilane synthase
MPKPANNYTVVCRGSLLSRAQAEHFIAVASAQEPQSKFTIVIKETTGDLDQQTLLQDMDGKDFFTREIQDFLLGGQADFAVHSLKDVSSELFFKDSHYAVISREDPRDVAIFNGDVLRKIGEGIPLKIGTSSPRRALMATRFLGSALPTTLGKRPKVEAAAIRGNVDTRLQKLSLGHYDGIILASAGLNRLLRYAPASTLVKDLLIDKRIIVLPLIECPPAPGQGAIVAETTRNNQRSVELLKKIDRQDLREAAKQERLMAAGYGSGCHQQFGIVHITTPHISFTFGAGTSRDGTSFATYTPVNVPLVNSTKIFSAGDHMKSFFHYDYPFTPAPPETKAIFAGSHHALATGSLASEAAKKRIWAAGTKTWFKLAENGLWIEGCADAMGLEFIAKWMTGPLIGLEMNDITVLTDIDSASGWAEDGWKALGTYKVSLRRSKDLEAGMAEADVIFWTSFRQYSTYNDCLKPGVIHCCSTGRTALLFERAGIKPVVFPGIKGFNEWRKNLLNTATNAG